jgi:hypothetical protein
MTLYVHSWETWFSSCFTRHRRKEPAAGPSLTGDRGFKCRLDVGEASAVAGHKPNIRNEEKIQRRIVPDVLWQYPFEEASLPLFSNFHNRLPLLLPLFWQSPGACQRRRKR